jgi:hypothetical protein
MFYGTCNGSLSNRSLLNSFFNMGEFSIHVALPCVNDGQISEQSPFQHVMPAVKLTGFLANRNS